MMLGDLDNLHRIQWVEREMARWSYKPGFTFEVVRPERRVSAPFEPGWYGEMPSLRITAMLPDSRKETAVYPYVMELDDLGEPRPRLERRLIPISQTIAVPYYAETTEDFARWLASVLRDFEHHESREWLCRDGEIYDDPHKPGPRR